MLPFFIALYRFGQGIRAGLRDPEFQALLTLAIIILGTGTMFYHGVEHWSWLDSAYFSVTTLTTVSFGDLYPHTDIGKVFTIIYLLIGIGIILAFINSMAHHALQEQKNNRSIFPRFRLRRSEEKTIGIEESTT